MSNFRKIAILLTMASPLCGGAAFSSGKPVNVDALVADDGGTKVPGKKPQESPESVRRRLVAEELRAKLGKSPAKQPPKRRSASSDLEPLALSPTESAEALRQMFAPQVDAPGHVRGPSVSEKSRVEGNGGGGFLSPANKPPLAKTPPAPQRHLMGDASPKLSPQVTPPESPQPNRSPGKKPPPLPPKKTPSDLSLPSSTAAELQARLGTPPAKRPSNNRSPSTEIDPSKAKSIHEDSLPNALKLATDLAIRGLEVPATLLELAAKQLSAQTSQTSSSASNANGGQGDGAKKQ